jgi:hypothetical protein
MQRKIGKLVMFFLFVINLSYAKEWRPETWVPVMDELKDVYHTNSYFASRENIRDYAAITGDIMLFAVSNIGLVLYDFKQDKRTIIPSPLDPWETRVFRVTYNEKNNTAHIITSEGLPQSHFYYYVLSLDTYSWDKIEELSFPKGETGTAYYDSSEEKIYSFGRGARDIIVFDLQAKKIVEKIKIFEEKRYYKVHAIYGNPVRILGEVQTETDSDVSDYFIYDLQTRTIEIFQNTFLRQERNLLRDYVPLGPYRFLCIQSIKLDLSIIIEIDLFNDTYKTIAFDNFNHHLSHLKRNRGNLMNFIVGEEIGYIFRVVRLVFCSWEYPNSGDSR